MKKLILLAAALAAAAAVLAGSALAGHKPTTVTVAMHDPGCHWFLVAGQYRQALVVSGPVSLRNLDEAALNVKGPGGTRIDQVGKNLALGHGRYQITMVKQASDDNTLWLVVR